MKPGPITSSGERRLVAPRGHHGADWLLVSSRQQLHAPSAHVYKACDSQTTLPEVAPKDQACLRGSEAHANAAAALAAKGPWTLAAARW